MQKSLFALAGALALLAVPAAGRAARVEADPNKDYPITPEAGPYVICVKSYRGTNAGAQARQLVLHLRQNGWPAFLFDYTEEERKQAQAYFEERNKNLPPELRKTWHVEPQYGVLIGGYKDFGSASADIPNVKKTPEPPPPKGWVEADIIDPATRQIYRLNTYAQCIATRNPTVRAQKADPSAPDPAWKQLNDGRPYNLLKCGKPWTLAVCQFQGTVNVQPRSAASEFLNKLGMGSSGDMLEASARQAEEVARVLCLMKVQAYVLHTRYSSIVTVGAFDRPDDKGLQDLAKELKGKRFGATGIKLFDEPKPMPVPQL